MDEHGYKYRGQPTKYREEYCDLTGYLEYCEEIKELPSKVGLACFLSVCEKTIDNWGEANPKFLRSLEILLVLEKRQLVNRGLDSTYNSTIAKLLLSANHGMREGTDWTSGGKPIKTQQQIVYFGDVIAKKDNDDTE